MSDHRLRIDRRTTIKWLAASMAVAHAGCSRDDKYVGADSPPAPAKGDLLLGTAATPDGKSYGTDPDLMNPVVPWAKTMTEAQLATASVLCDLIIPADDHSPAASAVGVPDFIDEWVSAPYQQQQDDRPYVLDGLEWLEQQSRERFGASFVSASPTQQSELLDRLAYPSDDASQLTEQIEFFRRFRFLATGAFYSTEAGIKDVGYIGNVAIVGPYPGPSDEAMEHLNGVLKQLGLNAVARTG
jgi:hypothetical protein